MRIRIADRLQHLELGRLDDRNHLLAFHPRESVEEILDGLTPLEAINQILKWHARADKHRRASENLRIRMDDAFQGFSRYSGNDNRSRCSRPYEFLRWIQRPTVAGLCGAM